MTSRSTCPVVIWRGFWFCSDYLIRRSVMTNTSNRCSTVSSDMSQKPVRERARLGSWWTASKNPAWIFNWKVDAALIVFVGDGPHDNPNTVIRAEPQQERSWLTHCSPFIHSHTHSYKMPSRSCTFRRSLATSPH